MARSSFLFGALAASLVASSALAADLRTTPVPMPTPSPVQAPVPSMVHVKNPWQGFYIGAEIGGDFFARGYGTINNGMLARNGVAGGLVFGHNWINNGFMAGFETALNFTDGRIYNANGYMSMPVNGALYARLGYAADNVLWSVKGGFKGAWINDQFGGTYSGMIAPGFSVGTGLDYAFGNNAFVGVHYDYSSFYLNQLSIAQSHGVKLRLGYQF